jgi:hypothetical protein
MIACANHDALCIFHSWVNHAGRRMNIGLQRDALPNETRA